MSLVHVKGLDEIQKLLDTLSAKMEQNVMRGALRAGMKPIRDDAKAGAAKATGELAAGLKVSVRARAGKVTASLRASGKHSYLARWIEYGTSAHYIKVQDSEKPINKRLSKKRGEIVRASMTTVNRNALLIGANFVGPTVFHPGAKPKPFMRPALDNQAEAAVVAAGEYIKKRLSTKHGIDTADIDIEAGE